MGGIALLIGRFPLFWRTGPGCASEFHQGAVYLPDGTLEHAGAAPVAMLALMFFSPGSAWTVATRSTSTIGTPVVLEMMRDVPRAAPPVLDPWAVLAAGGVSCRDLAPGSPLPASEQGLIAPEGEVKGQSGPPEATETGLDPGNRCLRAEPPRWTASSRRSCDLPSNVKPVS